MGNRKMEKVPKFLLFLKRDQLTQVWRVQNNLAMQKKPVQTL